MTDQSEIDRLAPIGVVTSAAYRDAMSQMAQGVTIVTTDGAAGRIGLTVSSIASVTDVPPSLLICVRRESAVNPILKSNGRFCVNVLGADQQQLADTFAGRTQLEMPDRFTADDWSVSQSGSPLLKSCAVAFDCHVDQIAEIGTHSVVFGTVTDIMDGRQGSALAYFKRRYHNV
jgi:flavin reductase